MTEPASGLRRLSGGRGAVAEELRVLALRATSRARRRSPVPVRDRVRVVVSLTSFPARIEHAWIPIETILRQDAAPDRVVLVLSDLEFPGRRLPRALVRQQARGLEVLWVPGRDGSLNKLVPTRLAYPDATVVTVDDDAMYEPWTVSALLAHARRHPGTVIGHRGWEVSRDGAGLAPYNSWPRASRDTPPERVFLTGVGGVLYPAGVLPLDVLADTDLARRLCPTGDDVWFWAVARAGGAPAQCLGTSSYRPLRRQSTTPELAALNRGARHNDAQLAAVTAHFGIDP